jgi:death-on-curing family protein
MYGTMRLQRNWSGLREASLLHTAVARPFATFGGVELYPSDFEKAAALFHSLIKSHPFMDGTKRTAFAATLYLLERLGHRIPDQLSKGKVIPFCVEVAEEAMRQAEGEPVQPKTIAQIAAWFKELVEKPSL